MDGGGGEWDVGGHMLLGASGRDDHGDAVGRVGVLQRTQLIGDGLRQRAGVAVIARRRGLRPSKPARR